MNFLKKADFFGVIFNWNLSTQDKKYRSAFGGFITILVYATSLLYFIYKIYLWKTNQILPTINTKESIEEYIEQNFYGSQPLKISMVSYGVDLFDWNKNILTCYFGYYVNYDLLYTKPLQPSPNNRSTETSYMIPTNITLVLNPDGQIEDNKKFNQFGFLLFAVCSQEKASEFNITCASEEEINFYLSLLKLSQFKFQIEVQQYDPISQSLKTVQKDHYFNVDIYAPFQAQITYQINQQYTDSNLFYQQLDNMNYIGQYNIITQPVSQEYIKAKHGQYGIAIIQFILDKNVQQMNVLFPKLGALLADVGSIMSTLLSLSIIVSIVNGTLLEDQLHQEIIQFYFPVLKNLQIKKNFFGKVIEVKNNNNVIDLDQYNIVQESLMEKVKIKLTLSNLIYEISRLQFIVQSQLSRQKLLEFHNVGISIDFGHHVTDHELRDLSHQEHRETNFIQFDDFNLLSMNRFQEEYKQIH